MSSSRRRTGRLALVHSPPAPHTPLCGASGALLPLLPSIPDLSLHQVRGISLFPLVLADFLPPPSLSPRALAVHCPLSPPALLLLPLLPLPPGLPFLTTAWPPSWVESCLFLPFYPHCPAALARQNTQWGTCFSSGVSALHRDPLSPKHAPRLGAVLLSPPWEMRRGSPSLLPL